MIIQATLANEDYCIVQLDYNKEILGIYADPQGAMDHANQLAHLGISLGMLTVKCVDLFDLNEILAIQMKRYKESTETLDQNKLFLIKHFLRLEED